mmetsp:Transcript_8728/g.19023  ORF Transcript_8728/g.19023 Transcript_8728/m.19023 type:complete len:112 (+) Transcript_8728:138-473(+)
MCNTHVEKKAKTDSEAPVMEAKKVEETTTAAEADAGLSMNINAAVDKAWEDKTFAEIAAAPPSALQVFSRPYMLTCAPASKNADPLSCLSMLRRAWQRGWTTSLRSCTSTR